MADGWRLPAASMASLPPNPAPTSRPLTSHPQPQRPVRGATAQPAIARQHTEARHLPYVTGERGARDAAAGPQPYRAAAAAAHQRPVAEQCEAADRLPMA